jgi:hypothetical protein
VYARIARGRRAVTAEIAVMNKQAVALAADSAVTVTGEYGPKIFASANKIFALSKHHPVGIMVFGQADFLRVPWETIVKEYRARLGDTSFPQVEGYAEDFLNYLRGSRELFPSEEQLAYAQHTIFQYYLGVRKSYLDAVAEAVREKGDLDDDEAAEIFKRTVDAEQRAWDRMDRVPGLPRDFERTLSTRLRDIIRESKDAVFERLPLTSALSRKLSRLPLNEFTKATPAGLGSGLVFAGFGSGEVFPAMAAFRLEGIVLNKLIYADDRRAEISYGNAAYIAPFAQSEMVATFMEGIDPSLAEVLNSAVDRIAARYPEVLLEHLDEADRTAELREKLDAARQGVLTELTEELERHQHESYVSPVISVVASLPKDELAAMAEALVNLTSFKRRVSMDLETVGGPIDVAVISKGDGFIWVKRKHYFDPHLNVQFFANYYRGQDGN